MISIPEVSRRTVLAGAASLTPGAALAALTVPAEHPDAALLELGRQFATLSERAAIDRAHLSALRDVAERDGPKRPDVLRPRAGDHLIGLHPRVCPGQVMPTFYDVDQIASLCGRQFAERQWRADQIINAYAQWRQATTDFHEKIGLGAAEQALDQRLFDLNAVEQAIFRSRATTLEGIGVIAAVALWQHRNAHVANPAADFAKIVAHLAQCIGELTPLPEFARLP